MTTFAMLVLTVFTVLGSLILGWLARYYVLGGRLDQFDADERSGDLHRRSGLASGAIGTVAAGTAAVGFTQHDRDSATPVADDADVSDSSSARSKAAVTGASADPSSSAGRAEGARGAAGAAAALISDDQADRSGSASDPVVSVEKTKPGTSETQGATITPFPERKPGFASSKAAALGAGSHTARTSPSAAEEGSEDAARLLSDTQPAEPDSAATPNEPSSIADLSAASASGDASGSSAVVGEADRPKARSEKNDSGDAAVEHSGFDTPRSAASRDDASVAEAADAPSSDADDAVEIDDAVAGLSGSDAAGTEKAGGTAPERDASLTSAKDASPDGGIDTDATDTVSKADSIAGDKATKAAAALTAATEGLASKRDDTDAAAPSDAIIAKHAELDASRAEARQLRERLGLESTDEGTAGDESKGLDARLAASREDTRALRQQLWSQEKTEAAADKTETNRTETIKTETQKTKDVSETATASATVELGDFGALGQDEEEAQRLLASGSAPSAASNRLEAPTVGFDPDDLTRIKGIGKPTAARLNRNGIYYHDQIAGFSAGDMAWADHELNLKGGVIRDRWVPQARLLVKASASSPETGETAPPDAVSSEGMDVDHLPAAGGKIVPPANLLDQPIEGRAPDDLTVIKGVGPKLQQQLNEHGLYYYSQIADFSATDQAWADETLGFPGRVERDNWIPQARKLAAKTAGGGDKASTKAGGARLNVLADAGAQLTSLAKGDAPGEMSEDEIAAMRLIESGEFVADESNRPKELLSAASEGAKDDLKQIKGVGPKLEDLLNNLGIFYFRQIAAFSSTDIAWVDSKLRFRGRIVRDRWVDQAKRLS